jgi:hypothetical protein
MRSFVRLCQKVTISVVLVALASAFSSVKAAEVSPKQFYLQYHQRCLVVSSPKALLPWRSKDSLARDEPMADEEIEQVYPMIRDMMSKNVTVISEEIKGDRATLKVTGEVPAAAAAEPADTKAAKSAKSGQKAAAAPATSKPEQAVGVVLLVKEGGQWKMDHESWTTR